MKVLLYSPCLDGHPQIYCRVIIDSLIKYGCELILASENSKVDVTKRYSVLSSYAADSKVNFINTRNYSKTNKINLTASELLKLQLVECIDSTLIVEGDHFREQFFKIHEGTAPKLRGRIVTILNNTATWYPGESKHSGEKNPIISPTLRGNLGKIKRYVFNHKQRPQYFYNTVLDDRDVVDLVVIKDERILKKRGHRFVLMPEIFKVFQGTRDDGSHDDEWGRFAPPIQKIIDAAGRQNIILFFGTGAWYKGYDLYLKFLEQEKSVVGIHAGQPLRFEKNKPFAWDVEKIRKTLLAEGRLFETGSFVKSARLIDFLFTSIERFVSTHRMAQSSGTMLQALDYGKPVLVPRAGCVGARAIDNHLGETYRYLDPDDLCEKWKSFREIPANHFEQDIQSFMQGYSQEKVESFFVQALLHSSH